MVVANQIISEYKSLQNVKSDFKKILINTTSNTLNLQYIESIFIHHPIFLRKVCMLHFIIMYYQKPQVQYYLESIVREHSVITANLIVNYSIEFNLINSQNSYQNNLHIDLFPSYTRYSRFEYCNSFNSLHVAALWSNDEQLIRLLYMYGAQIWSCDQHGFYADELSNSTPYFDHLLEYYTVRNNPIQGLYYTKRSLSEYDSVNREITLLAGESTPQEHGLTNWMPPLIIPG